MIAINLLPWRAWREARQQRWRRGGMWVIILFALLLGGVVHGVLWYQRDQLHAHLQRLNAQLAERQPAPEASVLSSEQLSVETLRQTLHTQQQHCWEAFQDVSQALPAQGYLTGWVREGAVTTLSGHAHSIVDVLHWVGYYNAHTAHHAVLTDIHRLALSRLLSFKSKFNSVTPYAPQYVNDDDYAGFAGVGIWMGHCAALAVHAPSCSKPSRTYCIACKSLSRREYNRPYHANPW